MIERTIEERTTEERILNIVSQLYVSLACYGGALTLPAKPFKTMDRSRKLLHFIWNSLKEIESTGLNLIPDCWFDVRPITQWSVGPLGSWPTPTGNLADKAKVGRNVAAQSGKLLLPRDYIDALVNVRPKRDQVPMFFVGYVCAISTVWSMRWLDDLHAQIGSSQKVPRFLDNAEPFFAESVEWISTNIVVRRRGLRNSVTLRKAISKAKKNSSPVAALQVRTLIYPNSRRLNLLMCRQRNNRWEFHISPAMAEPTGQSVAPRKV